MADLTEQQRQQITDYLSHPLDFPPEFKNYISDYVGMMVPKISVSQIFGFQLWGIESASPIETAQACSSTSYTSLATVGPEITNLANGFYIALWGGYLGEFQFALPVVSIGLSVNGAAPTDYAQGDAGAFGTAALLDLTKGSGGNSLLVKYKVNTAGTRNIGGRWLHALRVRTD